MLLAGSLLTGLPFLTAAAPPDARTTVNRYIAAWNAHDPDAAVATLAPGAAYFNSSAGTEREAKAAIGSTIRRLLGILPDLKWQVIGQPIVSASDIAFEWEVSGTYKPGREASAKPLQLRGASLLRVNGGRIAHLADYYDGASMQRQLGHDEGAPSERRE